MFICVCTTVHTTLVHPVLRHTTASRVITTYVSYYAIQRHTLTLIVTLNLLINYYVAYIHPLSHTHTHAPV